MWKDGGGKLLDDFSGEGGGSKGFAAYGVGKGGV
jgi:hypothetical protein